MKKLILVLPILFLLASCNSIKTTQTDKQKTEVIAATQLNDIWALVSIDGEKLDYSTKGFHQITLEIKIKDSTAIGTTGCNNFQAKMILDGDKVSFPPFPMTRKFCPGYEDVFVSGIMKTTSYKLEGLQLLFYDKEGKEVLAFKKVD